MKVLGDMHARTDMNTEMCLRAYIVYRCAELIFSLMQFITVLFVHINDDVYTYICALEFV